MGFRKYSAGAFEGGARSYAAQGLCSFCHNKPAEWMRDNKAFCEECKSRQERRQTKLRYEGAKEERKRANKHKTSSTKKILYLLKRGWKLWLPIGQLTPYSNACTWAWRITHPDITRDGYYDIPAKKIDELTEKGLIKAGPKKTMVKG